MMNFDIPLWVPWVEGPIFLVYVIIANFQRGGRAKTSEGRVRTRGGLDVSYGAGVRG